MLTDFVKPEKDSTDPKYNFKQSTQSIKSHCLFSITSIKRTTIGKRRQCSIGITTNQKSYPLLPITSRMYTGIFHQKPNNLSQQITLLLIAYMGK